MRKQFIATALACCALFAVSWMDDNNVGSQYDPENPAIVKGFSPSTGGGGTRLFISGKNFGTDPSRISVKMGKNNCAVIGSDGDVIYSIVPRRSFDGNISVGFLGENGDTVQKFSFDSTFIYQPKTTVGTLLRRVDDQGNSSFIMGSFDVASVPGNDWLVFDPKVKDGEDRILYSCDYYNGLRKCNRTKTEVPQPFTRTMYNTMMSFTFTADGDTLLFPDDNQDAVSAQRPNMYYALRSEGFKIIRAYNYGPCAMSIVSMPDGSKFYTSWSGSTLYKMIQNTDTFPNIDNNRKAMFKLTALGAPDGHTRMTLHPSGKYMYIYMPQVGCIMRSDYNAEKREFESPRIVAGRARSSDGCVEGTGGAARMDGPWAGVFVYNKDYEKNPQPDGEMYDFYFCAAYNHCVWKMTPNYVCTIVAGRGNYNVDGQYIGYVDGDPIKEARFNRPCGLAYDAAESTFYIGDIDNKAVRYLTTE